MSEESAAVSATPAATTPKKKAKSTANKPKTAAPTHPKVSEMVIAAITTLKERGGSSLVAIKKHIGSQHKVDLDRLTPFTKKYLKSAVVSGTLVQTKGKRANGSFKLSASGQKSSEPKKATKKVKKVSASPAKKAKAPAKKTAKPKAKAEKRNQLLRKSQNPRPLKRQRRLPNPKHPSPRS
ncbi:histone H1E [Trichonephila clavata]|uniref:Histone H1E n=1 Tax=Trichonephila clavata TaxID=2740835 RepID=A0A8X6GRG9_TRICU|nr:histone H1E [Trichonephila clavata]